jgi:pectate lyase
VSSASELLAAIKAGGSNGTIIKVVGTVDMAAGDNGGPFANTADQAKRARVGLQSHTTLIGIGGNAGLVNAYIYLKGVDNVIVRNLHIVNPCDLNPVWDPSDGATGNWNSQYDGITVDGASHVWIDHNHFTDAPQTDDLSPIVHGKTEQCHDGAVDIKNAADYVTLSNNVFELHDKNDLVGSSDSSTGDIGHLTVTFNNNLFSHITQRTPRVRFGRVHVYNNAYQGSKADPVYPQAYSIGVGYKALIISENNAFDVAGASNCSDVVANPGSASMPGAIVESGSLLNGKALDMGPCAFASNVGWTPPYSYRSTLVPAASVAAAVAQAAGTGKLNVAP